MAILLTGGTGKTSSRIAELLQQSSIPFLLTSRRGASASSLPTVKFDWEDSSTWDSPFEHNFPNEEKITAIYLVAGNLAEPGPLVNAFVDKGRNQYGVKRFVLCAGSSAEPGGPYHGKTWAHFLDIGVDWCVLRPSWFMENFSEPGQGHMHTIKNQGKIYSACGDGKIPFVSAIDIAAMAYKALTKKQPPNTSYRVLGPSLMTYDQAAETLTKVLGKEITHVKLSPEARTKSFIDAGLPEHRAGFLTWLEMTAANGKEQLSGDDVEMVTGERPLNFEQFVQENKEAWK